MYPGRNSMRHYNFWGCNHYCIHHFGGLASIHNHHDNHHASVACHDILVHPKARNQRDHNGNWRGHSCYLGLRRPFKTWDDKTKQTFTNWYIFYTSNY